MGSVDATSQTFLLVSCLNWDTRSQGPVIQNLVLNRLQHRRDDGCIAQNDLPSIFSTIDTFVWLVQYTKCEGWLAGLSWICTGAPAECFSSTTRTLCCLSRCTWRRCGGRNFWSIAGEGRVVQVLVPLGPRKDRTLASRGQHVMTHRCSALLEASVPCPLPAMGLSADHSSTIRMEHHTERVGLY